MRKMTPWLLLLVMAAPAQAVDREAAQASYHQGNVFFEQDRFTDASSSYGQAVAQDPQFLEAYYNRALADEMVDRQKAIADWHRFAEVAATPLSSGIKWLKPMPESKFWRRFRFIRSPCNPRDTSPLHRITTGRSRKDRSPRGGTPFPSKFGLGMCPTPIGRKARGRRSTSGTICCLWN